MQDPNRFIRRVAVLGAGVMGAQIAAHLSSAGLSVLLFDLPGKDDPNGVVKGALKRLGKLKPIHWPPRRRLPVSPRAITTRISSGCARAISLSRPWWNASI